MKTKKMSKKLNLNKITIADIKKEAMKKVYGGSDGSCQEFCLDPGGTGGGVSYFCTNTCNTCDTWCCSNVLCQSNEFPTCI